MSPAGQGRHQHHCLTCIMCESVLGRLRYDSPTQPQVLVGLQSASCECVHVIDAYASRLLGFAVASRHAVTPGPSWRASSRPSPASAVRPDTVEVQSLAQECLLSNRPRRGELSQVQTNRPQFRGDKQPWSSKKDRRSLIYGKLKSRRHGLTGDMATL